MNIKQIFLEALEKSSTDNSIENGIFDISKQEHIEILRSHLLESNIDSKNISISIDVIKPLSKIPE
jgi:hypothetical protein